MSLASDITVPIAQLRRYDRDPRRDPNPKYAQIKESIRAQGITNRLTVTRRPGDDCYVPYAGGNTRVQVLHELWHETGDDRFANVDVSYRAWPGEAAVIAAHLFENNVRGDTSFWDNACGLWELKSELERAAGRPLSSSELVREAKALGMDFGRGSVLTLLFAREALEPLGPWLTFSAVHKVIKPAVLALQGLCHRLDLSSDDVQRLVLAPVSTLACILQAQHSIAAGGSSIPEDSAALDPAELVMAIRRSVAEGLGISSASLEAALQAWGQDPDLSNQGLRAIIGQAADLSGRSGVDAVRTSAPIGMLPVEGTAAHPLSSAAAVLANPGASAGTKPSTKRARVQRNGSITAQSPPATFADAESSVAITRVSALEIVTLLCTRGELSQLLHPNQALPFGYYMEVPSSRIADRRRQLLWLLLSSLSGQCDPTNLGQLPTDSAWRCAMTSSVNPEATLREVMAESFVVDAITPLDLLRCFSDEAICGVLAQFLALALSSKRAQSAHCEH